MKAMRVAVIAGEGPGIGRWMRPTIKLLEGLATKPVAFEEHEFTNTAAIRRADAALFGSVARPSALRKGSWNMHRIATDTAARSSFCAVRLPAN